MDWILGTLKCYQNPDGCPKKTIEEVKPSESKLDIEKELNANERHSKDQKLLKRAEGCPTIETWSEVFINASFNSEAFKLSARNLKEMGNGLYFVNGWSGIQAQKVEYGLEKKVLLPLDVGEFAYDRGRQRWTCMLVNLVRDSQSFRQVVLDGSMDFTKVETACWRLALKESKHQKDRDLMGRLIREANKKMEG